MTLLEKLSAPFPPATISWRVGATNQDKSKGMALAYIDARDVQDRLNEVCGHEWQCKHHNCGNGMLGCEIGIKVDGEWLWRGDGAGQSDVEAEKGAFSDSFKRSAVRWGIGRYLYDLDSPWVEIEQKGNSYVFTDRAKATLRATLYDKAQSNVEAPTRPAEAPARPAISREPAYYPSLSVMRDALLEKLEHAKTIKYLDEFPRENHKNLEEIKKASKPTYDRIMRLAGERRGQLIEAPRVDAGSAPMLMGEP